METRACIVGHGIQSSMPFKFRFNWQVQYQITIRHLQNYAEGSWIQILKKYLACCKLCMLRGRFGDWDGWMDAHRYPEEGKQVQ